MRYIIPTLLLSILAYFVQTIMPLNSDVGVLLHETQLLLQGGHYLTDFFETNPPLILYLYSPVWLLAKTAALPVIDAFPLYVFLLSTLSTGFSYFLLRQLIRDKITFYLVFYTLLLALLFLPASEFGQREHFFILLFMPYLLTAALVLDDQPRHPVLCLIVGLLAGCGVALKPFFVAPVLLIEAYLAIRNRSLFALLRIELGMMLIVIMSYLSVLLVLEPHYLHVVLPLVIKYYFVSRSASWSLIFSNYLVIFCFLALFSGLFFPRQSDYRSLSALLSCGLSGTIIAFMIPQAPWYIHVLPAVVLAYLLLALRLGQLLSCWTTSLQNSTLLFKLLPATCIFFAYFISTLSGVGFVMAASLGCFVLASSLSRLPYQRIKQHLISLTAGALIISCFWLKYGIFSDYFDYLMHFTPIHSQHFLVYLLIILLAYGPICLLIALAMLKMLSLSNHCFSVQNAGCLIALILAIYVVPMQIMASAIQGNIALWKDARSPLSALVNYIKQQPGKASILCFSQSSTSACFPLVYYTQSTYTGRFPLFWWISGMHLYKKKFPVQDLEKDQTFLIEQVAEDLDRGRPEWIIIHQADFQQMDPNFDIIQYLSTNQKFRHFWQHYQYQAISNCCEIYKRKTA